MTYMGLRYKLVKQLHDIQSQASNIATKVHRAGIITGKMEDCAVGTVSGLSRLAEQVSGTLESCIEELALK